jgi:peptidoglycan/xylan/chitin deacetylase (PgdA/CDA1 family)
MPLVLAEPDVELANRSALLAPPVRVPRGRPRRRSLRERLLVAAASVLGDCLGPREAHAVGVLMYHRICDVVPGKPRPTWNVTPELLESQLAGLLRRGWQAWPLRQVLHCYERELPIPRKTFVVTFDDGYANNFLHALPVLARLHVPATLFLATAYLDSPRPFPSDDWSAAGLPGVPSDTWRPLTTDEAQRLTANGLVELGAHTHTHADFRGRPEALLADLKQNLTVLRERFGVERPPLAFPYGTKADGFVSRELAAAAREAGVACCLTTEEALIHPHDDSSDYGRFAAEEHDSPRTLAARLGGWTVAIRRRFRGQGSERMKDEG